MQIQIVNADDIVVRDDHRGNRAPLVPLKMTKLPLGAVRPHGWLRHQLDLMVEGMTGRLDEMSPFLSDENGWFVDGNEGWEEQSYWLRGFYSMAVLTGDKRCLSVADKWIEAVINGQQDDGWFGSSYHKRRAGTRNRFLSDLWPHMVMLDALRLHHEHTGDERVPALMARFFDFCREIPDAEFIPELDGAQWQEYREDFGDWKVGVQMKRAGDMLPHIYWLYNINGDERLLELASRFHHGILPPLSEYLDNHVVHFTQRFAYPAIYGQQEDLAAGLAETEYWYRQHMTVWGQQPRGAFASDEHLRPGKVDPRYGFEMCAMIEFAKSFYQLGRITGAPLYADRCEDVMLNHFPASQMPDLKGLHYVTASNQPELGRSGSHDCGNEANGRRRGVDNPMFRYSPHLYRCCRHNVAMGWPFHAENLWQGSGDGGLVAWLDGASEVTAGDLRLREDTNYPFDGSVQISVAEGGGEFPLYLRIPGWCRQLSVAVNGEEDAVNGVDGDFVRIAREWAEGNTVDLEMPMEVSHTRWPRNRSVTIDRGPLSYSVRIQEQWKRCGGTDEWPDMEVLPASDWNYALVTDDNGAPIVENVTASETLADQPWSVDNAPLELKVKAKRVPDWVLEEGGSVPELQKSTAATAAQTEEIRMIPMGCARLRMSCLPTTKE